MFKTLLFTAASAAFSAGDYESTLVLTAHYSFSHSERVSFMRAVSAFKVGDLKAAREAATDVVDQFRPPERRHDAVCRLILHELASWEEKGLSTVGRKMGDVASRLDVYKGGPVTQAKQKKILDDLDEMIAKAEEPQGPKEQARSAEQSRPRERSELPVADGSRDAKLDERKLKQLAETWGKLPPHERQRVVQEYTRELPPKYAPLILEYFRQLNKEK